MNKIFITNHYKVLQLMYENTISIKDKEYCPLGQREIAEKLCLSRININKIFKELRENGYITMITRGKWQLTDKAKEMIHITKDL